MLLWLQYHLNTSGGAVAVGAVWLCCYGCNTSGRCSLAVFLWVQYQFNNIGGSVAISAVWVGCCGCNTSLIIVVAL